ncbi:MAG: hypothetical protein LBG30_07290 [Odoribacteraceae bacterium]|jgi:F0F1-type ATP synthase membrane subunit c/vacuolar-type H+-ATPase subunit K|nr:hypothetical protein [Odoribacteraceae bacterium]
MKKTLLTTALASLFAVTALTPAAAAIAPDPVELSDIMPEFFFWMRLGVLVQLLYFAVLIVPLVLWFLGRKGDNFSRQITRVARVDIAFAAVFLLVMLIAGDVPSIKMNGWFYDALYLLLGTARVFTAWKMRGGATFGSLFKRNGVNPYLFVAYLLMTAFVAITTLISLIFYLIFAAACVVIFWILIKFDVLSMAFGGSGSKRGSRNTSGPPDTCSTCRHYSGTTCDLGNKPVGSNAHSYGCSSWVP